jgi:hypothetical protein
MEQSLSWETDNHLASQQISRRLWNQNVHYCVHKTLPLDPTWVVWIQSTSLYMLFTINFNIILQFMPRFKESKSEALS